MSYIKSSWSTLNRRNKLITFSLGVTSILCIRKIVNILYRKWYNYPPGPCGLPILGSLLQLGNYPYFKSLANRYGSIFMINAGFTTFVFINDLEILTKTYNKKQCGDRKFGMGHSKINCSLVFLRMGPELLSRRQLLLKSFVNELNVKYLNEACSKLFQRDLYKILDECCKNNTSFNVFQLPIYSSFGLIWTVLFGNYMDIPSKTDPIYVWLRAKMKESATNFRFIMMMYIIMGISDLSLWILKNSGITTNFIKEYLIQNKQFEAWFDTFLDKYNSEKQQKGENFRTSAVLSTWIKEYEDGNISKKDIVSDISSIFGTATDTTMRQLSKTLIDLVKYPYIQQQVYQELKDIVGNDEENILIYIPKLHKLRACIDESLRKFENQSIIESLPRTVMVDNLMINGYNIPKNCQLIAFNQLIQNDKKYWNNPNEYDINNFLDINGKYKSNPAQCAFGKGRRSCPGQSLARKMMYILIGKIILKYKLHSNGKELPSYCDDFYDLRFKGIYHLYVSKR